MQGLNEEAMREWIAALRSGQYIQTFNRLHTYHHLKPKGERDRFCAAGVACHLFAPRVGIETIIKRNRCEPITVVSYGPRHTHTMPYAITSYLHPGRGVFVPRFLVPGHEGRIDIERVNDHLRFSFPQIADLLETTYLT